MMKFMSLFALVAMVYAKATVVEVKTGNMVLTVSNYVRYPWGCNMRVTCAYRNMQHVTIVQCTDTMCSDNHGAPLVVNNITMTIPVHGKTIGCTYNQIMVIDGKTVNASHKANKYHHNTCLVDTRDGSSGESITYYCT